MQYKHSYLLVLLVGLGIGGGQAFAFDLDAALREAREQKEREADAPALEIASQRYSLKGKDRGIVVDPVTNLEWMRCSLGQTWNPQRDTCDGDASRYNWNDAMLVPKVMNEAGGYSGYNDWRVPTIDELRTLVFCSRRTPPIDPEGGRCPSDSQRPTIFLEMFPNTPTGDFWSASPVPRASGLAWGVRLHTGAVLQGFDSANLRVRLVRDSR